MEDTKIEWCDNTFNPWTGCTKVSPGCANCYAESWSKRSGIVKWGKGQPRRRTNPSEWAKVRKWNKQAESQPNRPRVFCASLADWLDDEVPNEWLADLLVLIQETPHLDWLLLTKRPENWKNRLARAMARMACTVGDPCDPYTDEQYSFVKNWLMCRAPANVWIGATVENQDMANQRIPLLLEIPAKVRFLSCEPLLGPVDLGEASPNPFGFIERGTFHWVICGGESGPGARPMHPDWARSLRDQCKAADIPFLFKQWGEWFPKSSCNWPTGKDEYRYGKVEGRALIRDGRCAFMNTKQNPAGLSIVVDQGAVDKVRQTNDFRSLELIGYQWMHCIGKKKAGRLLDGIEHNEFPKP